MWCNPRRQSLLELRQSDAHAWVELWLKEEGWQRVDPTLWASNTGLPAAVLLSQGSGLRRRSLVALAPMAVVGPGSGWTLVVEFRSNQSAGHQLQMLFGAQFRWLGVAVVVSGLAALLGGWLLLRLGLRPAHLWLSPFAFWPGGVLSPCRGFRTFVGEPRGCSPIWPRCFRPWRISSSCLLMPLTASQRRHHSRQWQQLRSRLGRIIDLSACLIRWQAHGRRDPQQKPWMFNPAGGWPDGSPTRSLWHLDCRGDAAADQLAVALPTGRVG